MIKRLIFDIDGTLITGISFDKAIKKSLLELGLFSDENKQKFFYAISTYENSHSEYEINQYLQYFSKVLGYKLGKDFLDIFFRNLRLYAIPEDNNELVETIEKLSKNYELFIEKITSVIHPIYVYIHRHTRAMIVVQVYW